MSSDINPMELGLTYYKPHRLPLSDDKIESLKQVDSEPLETFGENNQLRVYTSEDCQKMKVELRSNTVSLYKPIYQNGDEYRASHVLALMTLGARYDSAIKSVYNSHQPNDNPRSKIRDLAGGNFFDEEDRFAVYKFAEEYYLPDEWEDDFTEYVKEYLS